MKPMEKQPGVADFEHALRIYQAGLKQEAYYFYRPERPGLSPILVRCHGVPVPDQIASSKSIHADTCHYRKKEKEPLQLSLHHVAKIGVAWAYSDKFTYRQWQFLVGMILVWCLMKMNSQCAMMYWVAGIVSTEGIHAVRCRCACSGQVWSWPSNASNQLLLIWIWSLAIFKGSTLVEPMSRFGLRCPPQIPEWPWVFDIVCW